MDVPKTSEEARAWVSTIRRYALASRVLVVAKTRIEGTWKAYVDAVPGINHDCEWAEVADCGDRLREDVARILFPEFDDVPYAH